VRPELGAILEAAGACIKRFSEYLERERIPVSQSNINWNVMHSLQLFSRLGLKNAAI